MAETNTTTQTTEATSQTAEKPQNNAPAPAEGNDTKGQETTPQNAAQPSEKTFTQDELNKILADRLKSEQKRWEKKAADEKAEAERVAKMSAEEKAKHEQEKEDVIQMILAAVARGETDLSIQLDDCFSESDVEYIKEEVYRKMR